MNMAYASKSKAQPVAALLVLFLMVLRCRHRPKSINGWMSMAVRTIRTSRPSRAGILNCVHKLQPSPRKMGLCKRNREVYCDKGLDKIKHEQEMRRIEQEEDRKCARHNPVIPRYTCNDIYIR